MSEPRKKPSRRKKSPEAVAEELIQAARVSGALELDLGTLKLRELTASIAQLSQLQKLYVWGNQLTALPEWVGQLRQLRQLNVTGNQLTALPESVRQLRQLRELYIWRNQL